MRIADTEAEPHFITEARLGRLRRELELLRSHQKGERELSLLNYFSVALAELKPERIGSGSGSGGARWGALGRSASAPAPATLGSSFWVPLWVRSVTPEGKGIEEKRVKGAAPP